MPSWPRSAGHRGGQQPVAEIVPNTQPPARTMSSGCLGGPLERCERSSTPVSTLRAPERSAPPAGLRLVYAGGELPVLAKASAPSRRFEREDERARERDRRSVVDERRPPLDRGAIPHTDGRAVPHLDVRLRRGDARPVFAHGRRPGERVLIRLFRVGGVFGEEDGRGVGVTLEPGGAVRGQPFDRCHRHRAQTVAPAVPRVNGYAALVLSSAARHRGATSSARYRRALLLAWRSRS